MLTSETLKTIKNRRSTRSFKNEQIKDNELQAVLEAGAYAPSGNDQAWYFSKARKLLPEILVRAFFLLCGSVGMNRPQGRVSYFSLFD